MKNIGITALGEILIDFVPVGKDDAGDILLARKAGGAPLNLLAAASKRGIKTALIGKVGNDLPGDYLQSTVEQLGINTVCLKRDVSHNTTFAFVELDENGDRKFSFTRQNGADRFLEKKDISEELLNDSIVFHFGSLSLTDEPGLSTTVDAVDRAKACGCMITYDPNYRPMLWRDKQTAVQRMKLLLNKVDIIKVSTEELTLLTDTSDLQAGMDLLASYSISLVLVTDGEKGAFARYKGQTVFAPAQKVKCVDTTGAGDIFFGAFLSQMLNNKKMLSDLTKSDVQAYLQYAVQQASLSTLFHGGIER